jgi:hypothetical protein
VEQEYFNLDAYQIETFEPIGSRVCLTKRRLMDDIVVPWPPALVQGEGGKFYAMSCGISVEVPADTDRAGLHALFCWGAEARKYWDSEHSEDPVKTIEVKGSKGKIYKVTKTGDKVEVQCRGFQFRQDCKHIQNLKNHS